MYSETRAIIESRFKDNWTDTPIDIDNTEYTPTPGQSFVRLQIEWVDAQSTSIGGRTKGTGYVDFSIFIPYGVGTEVADSYSDLLADLFSRYRESALRMLVATARRIGQQGNWHHTKVMVPFEYDTCYMNQ